MELQDFTEKEQEMIKKGLTFSKLSDKETVDKIIALIPQEYIKRIPFFVCLLYTSPSPRDRSLSRMPSSA